MAVTHLHNGFQCIKYLLFAVNSLFMLTGLMIMSIGWTIYSIYDHLGKFLDSDYVSPAWILFVVGILTFVIAFFGCLGAMRESTAMVLVFAVSLSIVLLLELSAVIAAFALRDGISMLIDEKILNVMSQYTSDPEAQKAVDCLQNLLGCCGSRGPQDWNGMQVRSASGIYPRSCDRYIIGSKYGRVSSPVQQGCVQKLNFIVNESAMYIGTGALAIMLIQLCGILFACSLGKAIRKQKTERDRRRWEFRQSLVNDYQPLQQKNINFAPICAQYTEEPPFKNIQ